MVYLSTLLFLRRTGFDTPMRVSRYRYIAKGAEYLFKTSDDSTLEEKFDGTYRLKSNNVIRMALDGCTNRPFYRIVVTNKRGNRDSEIEQLGTFDPMPNMFNEKLCSLNFQRIKYHLAMGAHPVKSLRRLLGLSGFLPLDPTLFIYAQGLQRRRKIEDLIAERENSQELKEAD